MHKIARDGTHGLHELNYATTAISFKWGCKQSTQVLFGSCNVSIINNLYIYSCTRVPRHLRNNLKHYEVSVQTKAKESL